MAELTCPLGHPVGPTSNSGPFCSEDCTAEPEVTDVPPSRSVPDAPPPPVGPTSPAPAETAAPPVFTAGVTVVVGTLRLDLDPGQTVLLGRALESPAAQVLRRYDNVGRRHLELVAGECDVTVRPLRSRNGTFVADFPLQPGEERVLAIPATVRMAANCFVYVEARGE